MQYVIKIIKHFHSDTLYRNSIYLILSTAVMSICGFFFWIINARLFSNEQIGIATSFFSVVSLLSSLSLLGFNNALIRFLPKEENKRSDINTVFTVIALASVFSSLIFILFLPVFSPALLEFSQGNTGILYILIFFVVIMSLNGITDSVFIAMKSAKYPLIINTIMSITKLGLPLLLFTFGTNGLIYTFVLSVLVAIALSLVLIRIKFNIPIIPTINRQSLSKMAHFSLSNYVANFIGALPTTILPLFILNTLGAKTAAYFYMPMMIANLLYIIPSSTTKSLLAEGSYNEEHINRYIKKALFLIFFIMIPVIGGVFLLGKFVLLTFGKNYSSEGTTLLYLLAVSGIFVSINSVIWTLLIIKKRVKLMIGIAIISTASIFLFTYLLIGYRLTGVGLGWLLGQATVTVIELFLIKYLFLNKNK